MSMNPRVQYAKTSDGVSIAFTTYGEGPPLVIPPNLYATHLQLELEFPQYRSFFERLSRRLQLIRYDCRGLGMSQRDAIDFSAEAAERDLCAVVDRLGLERFALYSHVLAGEGPMAFAANHPDRVMGLVWWIGPVGTDPESWRTLSALEPLIMESEWELYINVRARLALGWDSPAATAFAAILRAGASPASLAQVFAARRAFPSEYVPRVRVPAMIAHLAGAAGPADRARVLASEIPTSHVVSIPGHPSTLMAFVYDNEILTEAIADFVESLAADPSAPDHAPELRLGAMRAILFTDIVGHTEMMQRLGDAKGRDVLREHERITREMLKEHGGAEVKAMGDGFMAWFSSAHQALDCAVALQRAFSEPRPATAHLSERLQIRAGINAGEPIVEDDDLFGSSVIAAARICREAAGGEIVVSDVVRQLVAGKGFTFADRGAVALKGFDEPIRLYGVQWRPGSP